MAKWVVETYASAADLETAIEALDTTVTPLQVVPYREGPKQVFKLIYPGA
ncbi:MAG TPA: hypothetical protein PK445_07220 [Methanolinea sp.]|nr:hypothetical protein [Methanolinea sp.]HQJ88435.1 hypothetical protein [Methanoregulaceae archaeon]